MGHIIIIMICAPGTVVVFDFFMFSSLTSALLYISSVVLTKREMSEQVRVHSPDDVTACSETCSHINWL